MGARALHLEVNSQAVKDREPLRFGEGVVMVTPPIGEDFWLARVPLSPKQALVCFPKFGTIGIGFQVESDWNTNLPYTEDSEDIFEHIKHNRGRCRATDAECIQAIVLLSAWASGYRRSA